MSHPRDEEGTDEWFAETIPWARNMLRNADVDIRPVGQAVPHLRQCVERHGLDWVKWCEDELWQNASFVDLTETASAILEGTLTVPRLTSPTPGDRAALARAAGALGTEKPLVQQGKNPRDATGRYNVTSERVGEHPRGNSAAYRAARIARDRPDVAARLAAGEFPSVRAAEVEAGLYSPPKAEEVARKAVRRVSDRVAFVVGLVRDLDPKEIAELRRALAPLLYPEDA